MVVQDQMETMVLAEEKLAEVLEYLTLVAHMALAAEAEDNQQEFQVQLIQVMEDQEEPLLALEVAEE